MLRTQRKNSIKANDYLVTILPESDFYLLIISNFTQDGQNCFQSGSNNDIKQDCAYWRDLKEKYLDIYTSINKRIAEIQSEVESRIFDAEAKLIKSCGGINGTEEETTNVALR